MTERVGRRQFLRAVGGTGALGVAGLSGCTAVASDKPGESTLEGIANEVGEPVHVGGPNDLKSDVTVRMAALKGNQGNGFAYLPGVVWLEPGGTVTWKHTAAGTSERVSHTITLMNKGTGKPQYSPKNASAFDSGVIAGLGPWKNESALEGKYRSHLNGERPNGGFQGPYKVTFEAPEFPEGVYFYMCEDHMFFGMVGAVVVGDVGPDDPGWSPAMTAPPKKKMFTDVFTKRFEKLRDLIRTEASQ